MGEAMEDHEWENLVYRVINLRVKMDDAREEAEKEYERRFGHRPLDINDDWWIHTMEQQKTGGTTGLIEGLIANAKRAVRLHTKSV